MVTKHMCKFYCTKPDYRQQKYEDNFTVADSENSFQTEISMENLQEITSL